jgi:RNA recognition motif-containing protein
VLQFPLGFAAHTPQTEFTLWRGTIISLEFFVLNKNIYVGNLSWGCTDQDLRNLFADFGEVASARVIEDRETGRSRGFGFVEMDANGATQAIEALNGTNFQGRDLRVNEAQPRERRPRY